MNEIEIINKFLNLFLQFKCVICGEFPRKMGYCHKHYDYNNITKIQNNFNDMLVIYYDTNNDKQFDKIINEYIKPLRVQICETRRSLYDNIKITKNHNIIKKQAYLSNLVNKKYKLDDIASMIDEKNKILYINYDDILNYINECIDKYLSEYDMWNKLNDDEKMDIIKSNAKEYNYIQNTYYNESNKVSFLKIKLLVYELEYINKWGKIKCLINNNNICISELIKTCDKILYISDEYNISINNTTYRTDIYIIIKTKDDLSIELCIELDECKHFYGITISDIYKDMYCFKNGISLMRYYCKSSNFCEIDTHNICKFINDIYESCMPKYYFADKYIKHKKKLFNNKKVLDISNELSEYMKKLKN